MTTTRVKSLMAEWRTLRFALSEEDAAEAWAESMAVHEDQCALAAQPVAGLDALMVALHETAPHNHNLGEGPLRAICASPESHRPRAEAILARFHLSETQ